MVSWWSLSVIRSMRSKIAWNHKTAMKIAMTRSNVDHVKGATCFFLVCAIAKTADAMHTPEITMKPTRVAA